MIPSSTSSILYFFIFFIIFDITLIVLGNDIEDNSEDDISDNDNLINISESERELKDKIIKIIKSDLEDETENRQQSLFGLPEEIPEIDDEFNSRIKFIIFKDGQLIYNYDEYDRNHNTSLEQYCNVDGNYTFIIHGWRESSETEWVQLLVSKFTETRQGCIVSVDYQKLAYRPYSNLLQYFEPITNVLYDTIEAWRLEGLDLNRTHIFGFDFGGRIALKLGEKLGTQEIMSIDVCDIAGPGFDEKYGKTDFRLAAQNVQCIHTSSDKGTRHYNNCHQDWRMGVCGYRQRGSEMSPLSYYKYKSSHRICPYYYLLSFDKDILAQEKPPIECLTENEENSTSITKFPENFKLGFLETRQAEVQGQLFVSQPPKYPFKEYSTDINEESTITKVLEYYREDIVGYRDSPSTIEQVEKSIIEAIRGIEPALLSLVFRFG